MPQSINLNRLINYRKLTMLHIVGYSLLRLPQPDVYYYPPEPLFVARLHVLGFGRAIVKRRKPLSYHLENMLK